MLRPLDARAALCLALSLAGCVSVPSGRFACGSPADCPSGWACTAGRCHAPGNVPDASVADAPLADGGDLDAPRDAGRDATSDAADASADGGMPAHVRVVHLLPGASALHVCLGAGGSWTLLADDAVAYRQVGASLALTAPAGTTVLAAYDPADLVGGECPATTASALVTATMTAGTLAPAGTYTVAITGLAAGGSGEEEPELVLVTDDPTPAAGLARVRLFDAVPNALGAVDLCLDRNPGDADPGAALATNVTFETASPYVSTPAVTNGLLRVHVHGAPACTTTLLAELPVPLLVDETDGHVGSFPGGSVATIVVAGDAELVRADTCTLDIDCVTSGPSGTICGPGGVCTHPLVPRIFAMPDGT